MEFRLPEIGEGVHEGELVRWLVKNGDTVQADQPLLEVMTDKATVEIPAPAGGVVSGISAKEGAMIKIGQTLAQIAPGAGAASNVAASAKTAAPPPQNEKPAAAAAAAPTPTPTRAAPTPETKRSEQAAPRVAAPAAMPYVGAIEALGASTVPAAPIVRAMAQRAGVDLAQVPASGPAVGTQNRVLEADLVNFLAQRERVPAPTNIAQNFAGATRKDADKGTPLPIPRGHLISATSLEERRPVRGIRRAIAQAMVRSKFTAPHYGYVDEFECSALVELREQAKAAAEKYGIKFTYLPFVVKAVVAALREFPEVNSSLEEKPDGSMELVIKKYFHIGFAVATEQGLLVPVIKHADQKSLLEIAGEMFELSNKTRAGKAAPDDLKGSTFTITSMGNVGGLFAMPIINYPEVGILGVFKVQEKPIVREGKIVVGKTMHLSLSLDHRVVDGTIGAQFCNAIIERLANPARLMMELS